MIVDRTQSRWYVGTGAAAVVALAAYFVYAVLSPNGPQGGSVAGLVFASLGTGVIVFECLLGLRKVDGTIVDLDAFQAETDSDALRRGRAPIPVEDRFRD